MRCGHCPVPADLPCDESGIRCRRAGEPGNDAFRAMLVRHARIHAQTPGMVQKAVNFVGAVLQHAAAGMPAAPDDVKAARLAICRSNRCGLYREGDICGHSSCGCNLVAKAGWADQACPLGLWAAVIAAPPAAPSEPCRTAD